MIKGIHHVAFKCETQEQYDEMICFYHELLELPVGTTSRKRTHKIDKF